jgi:hypothetical protein
MKHKRTNGGVRRETATPADIVKELHRLRESKMHLVLMAEKAGLAVPRSCCPHPGATACVSCSSDWLVAHLRVADGAAT